MEGKRSREKAASAGPASRASGGEPALQTAQPGGTPEPGQCELINEDDCVCEASQRQAVETHP